MKPYLIPFENGYIVGSKRLTCLQPNDKKTMNPNKNDTNSFWVDDTHLSLSSITHNLPSQAPMNYDLPRLIIG